MCDVDVEVEHIKNKFKDSELTLIKFKNSQQLILDLSATTDLLSDLLESQLIIKAFKENELNTPFIAKITQIFELLSKASEVLGLLL